MNTYQIAGCTDVGRARQHNEDSMIAFESPNGYVVAVCDGMGGENGGETASNLAVAIIQDILTNNVFTTASEAITVACNAANQGILHRASSNPDLEGMGSTCVIALIKDGQIYYGTIGDSRIYYYSKAQGLVQLSKDQSYVQTLVDNGEITPEEAESHPRKNEILNALGLDGMTPPVVCEQPVPVNAGGMMMLCSDGLSGMVPDFTIEQVLSRPGLTPQQRCEKLINMANEAGGMDNITVQIIDCKAAAGVALTKNSKSTSQTKQAPRQKKSFAWVGIAVFSALLCTAVGYLGWDYFFESNKPKVTKTRDTKDKEDDHEIDIPRKNSSGKVETKTIVTNKVIVTEDKSKSEKPTKKTKPTPETKTSPENNLKSAFDRGGSIKDKITKEQPDKDKDAEKPNNVKKTTDKEL